MAFAGFSPGAPPGPGLVATGIVSKTGTGVSAQTWQSIVAIDRGYDKSIRDVVGRMRLIEGAAGLGDCVGFEDCTSRADIEVNCGVCGEGCDPRNGGIVKAGRFFGARGTVRARNGTRSGSIGGAR